jgi:hypothetical protein
VTDTRYFESSSDKPRAPPRVVRRDVARAVTRRAALRGVSSRLHSACFSRADTRRARVGSGPLSRTFGCPGCTEFRVTG